MLYDLIKTVRGKEEVVMTDSMQKVKARLQLLRKSYRKGQAGQAVTLSYRESEEKTDKFKKPPRGRGY